MTLGMLKIVGFKHTTNKFCVPSKDLVKQFGALIILRGLFSPIAQTRGRVIGELAHLDRTEVHEVTIGLGLLVNVVLLMPPGASLLGLLTAELLNFLQNARDLLNTLAVLVELVRFEVVPFEVYDIGSAFSISKVATYLAYLCLLN